MDLIEASVDVFSLNEVVMSQQVLKGAVHAGAEGLCCRWTKRVAVDSSIHHGHKVIRKGAPWKCAE